VGKFHDIRGDVGGICHQILPENGYVRPATWWWAPTPTPPATARWAPSRSASAPPRWRASGPWAAPERRSARHHQGGGEGRFKKFVGPKDLILHLIGKLSAQGANFKVLEFHGETIRKMSTSGRLVLCNMSVEAGATAGIVPGDEETLRYLREEAGVTDASAGVAGRRRAYESVVEIDVSKLAAADRLPAHGGQREADRPGGARRSTRSSSAPAPTGAGRPGHGRQAILKGKKVAQGTRMLVFPASSKIYRQALGTRATSATSCRPAPW
jgi:homoaconitase/3-isopropylmalate dehydratase large subunit